MRKLLDIDDSVVKALKLNALKNNLSFKKHLEKLIHDSVNTNPVNKIDLDQYRARDNEPISIPDKYIAPRRQSISLNKSVSKKPLTPQQLQEMVNGIQEGSSDTPLED